MKQVLIAAPISEKFKTILTEKKYELFDLNNDSLAAYTPAFIEGIITSNKLILDRTELEKYANLRWIGRLGSGMEIIDRAYCAKNGILFYSSPIGIANSVAEHVTGMLLGLLHNINSSDHEIRSGVWSREPNRGIELENLTIGLIGYGNTGSALAKKLSVFSKSILAYDKFKSNFSNSFVKESSISEIQQDADILSFHVPLHQDTYHYYNDEFCSSMAKKHILINSARGAVASTQTILNGLESGKITGACLDVLEEEKDIENLLLQKNNRIRSLLQYKVILTPHIAGYSHNAVEKMCDELIQSLQNVL